MSEHVVLKKTISTPNISAPFPLWVQIVVILGIVLLTAGAFIALLHPALLVSPREEINPAVRVYAAYTFSRDLALAIMLVVALALRTRAILSTLMLLTGLVQFLDAFADCLDHRWAIVPAAAILSTLFLLGAAALSGSPFWKIQAWKHDA
jgi:hypothetical protein